MVVVQFRIMRSRTPLLLITVLSLSCVGARAGTTPLQAGRSVVLPPSEAQSVLRLCSRAGPRDSEATWLVPPRVVEQLEADLDKVTRLRATECCLLRGRVREPGSYYRQYVGLMIGGKRFVYVNAFASPSNHLEWREQAVGVCDGGEDYWGVLYDPQTRPFSQLAFNGIG